MGTAAITDAARDRWMPMMCKFGNKTDLAPTPSVDNLFHSFTVLCENEFFSNI